jgi:hypothetical protein
MAEMTRPQRVDLLVRRQAPLKLVLNEVKLALREYMHHDETRGLYASTMSWTMAAWSLACALSSERRRRLAAEREVRRLRKSAKPSEGVA